MKPLLISIAALLLASTAAAQSTRVDTIAEQQAEKSKQLGTEGPSEAEMIIRRVLLSPLLSGGDGLYPWFGSVYGGSGMGLGVGYLKRLENAAYLNLQTGISINGSMVMRGTFAAPKLWRDMLQLDANVQWLDAHDVSFYGFGQDSSKDARDRYDFNPIELSTNVTFKPMRHVFMTGSYAYTPIDTHRETPVFAPADSPGLDEKLTFHVTRGDARLRLAAGAGLQHARWLLSRVVRAQLRDAAAGRIRSRCRNTKWSSSCRSCANSSSWRAARW